MIQDNQSNKRTPICRWVVTAGLRLVTAAHFGGPNPDDRVDMILLRDLDSGNFMLPGASMAGALRSALNDVSTGYRQSCISSTDHLFGGGRRDDDGDQSPLYVYDCICENAGSALRDGVAISPEGIAKDRAKFDYEVIPAGATFPLRFDLHVDRDGPSEEALLSELFTALRLLEKGEIPLGAKKTRGLGRCLATNWRLRRFDLTTQKGWAEWLGFDARNQVNSFAMQPQESIEDAFKSSGRVPGVMNNDKRTFFSVSTDAIIDGSMLIRSAGSAPEDPDMAQLSENGHHIVPGTSIAGVLRSRCLRILKSMGTTDLLSEKIVREIFGTDQTANMNYKGSASRLRTMETAITDGPVDLIINRIRIDRFTGGVVENALFDQKPVFGGKIHIELRLFAPSSHEKGLLMLLFKDLITGNIPIGGESSIGRGRLKSGGKVDLLEMTQGKEIPDSWNPEEKAPLALQERLNSFVGDLKAYIAKEAMV
ncbi:MAG: hypothetical protein HQM09_21660 [Candidatus Riflebacteria bacterium]|nr:hypothetical protein [Candidatus Riflebacteria bacterium]